MNYRNTLFLSVFLFNLCSAKEEQQKITPQDIANHAQFWASRYVSDLNNDEITLLANLLYFNGKLIDEQIKVGNAILFAHVHAGMINNLIIVSEEDAQKVALASAVALRKLKEEYLPARKTSEKIIKHCLAELKKSEYKNLNSLLDGFNEYGSAIAAQFTRQDKASISEIIKECKTSFSQHISVLKQSTDTLQELLEDKNQYLKDNSDPDLANLHAALNVSDNTIMALSDMINKAIRIKRMSFDLMNISKMISYTFYQNILQLLAKEKRLPIFIMFNENGVITPEERWQDLPNLQ